MTDTRARVALITGCGKENGIGAAIARRLAADGVIIAATDVAAAGVENDNALAGDGPRWQGLDALTAQIEAAGGRAASFVGDVSNESDAARMVADTVARFGRLDILVNNAGAPHGADRAPLEQVPFADWQRVMNINVGGAFLMTRAA